MPEKIARNLKLLCGNSQLQFQLEIAIQDCIILGHAISH